MLVNAWVVEGPKAEEVAEVALVAVVVVVVVVAAAECEFVKRPCRRRIGRRWDLCACRRSRSKLRRADLNVQVVWVWPCAGLTPP